MKQKIIIVGAGLTGLLTAYRLQQLHYEVLVIEARNRIGGRIHTLKKDNAWVEMGATWFNDSHYLLKELVNELQVPFFEQFLQGTSYFQTFSNVPPQEIVVPKDSLSYRFKLGTVSLLQAIMAKLKPGTVSLNESVNSCSFNTDGVTVTTSKSVFKAAILITTLPPALLRHQIHFEPHLPSELIKVMDTTHTWMQDSIKVAFTFSKPFWREKGQSGTIFSNTGPLTEFYDQSNPEENSFALVGFASGSCARLPKEQRIQKIEEQLKLVFGNDALAYTSYHETFWSNEVYTKSENQLHDIFPHQHGGHRIYQNLQFQNRLIISGAETSPHHSGYMEGAVWAAQQAVTKIKELEA